MGIPIGWNITRDDAKDKDVLRADVTGQRSPIRRRIRPSRSPRSHSAFDAGLLGSSRFEPLLEYARTRLAPPPVPEVAPSAYRPNDSSRDPPSLQRENAGYRSSRAPPAYSARVAVGAQRSSSQRPLPALTPGFAPAAARRSAETDALQHVQDTAHRMGRLYYPADSRPARFRHFYSDNPNPDDVDSDDGHESSDNNAVGFPPLRRMGRRTIADGPLPSSSLRESWSPVSTADGLGDRTRSLSPMEEQPAWDTFLTTVVPDPVAPTAESSFASAAASASFSNSHPSSRAGSSNTSASSSRTHLTVPSRRHSPPLNDPFMRACDTSEDDTASDTEAEEDENIITARPLSYRYNPITGRRRTRPSYFSDEPPHRDTERYSRRVMERSRDATAYVRSFYNPDMRSLRDTVSSPHRGSESRGPMARVPRMEQLDGLVDGPAQTSEDEMNTLRSPNSPPLDQELRDAQSLLERLSRREDISDDFWASVGLTRSIADRVESFNERESL